MRRSSVALVAVLASAALLSGAGRASAAAPGSLDRTWNSTGIATTFFNQGGDDEANAIARQDDGRVVIAGKSYDGSSVSHMALARYLRSGQPDASFNGTGQVVLPLFENSEDTNGDQANAVAVQPGGKIIVAGSASDASGAGWLAVARYKVSGARDTTFGTDGQTLVRIGDGTYNSVNAIAVQPDGKIVLAGTYQGGWVVARLTSTGALDASFNSSGDQPGIQAFTLGDAFADGAYAVTITSTGAIVVGGSGAHLPAVDGSFHEDFALVRFTPAGVFDTTFGNAGVVRANAGADYDVVTSLATLSNGKIYAAGIGTDGSLTVARFLASGARDTNFATAGLLKSTVAGDPNNAGTGLAVLSDGTVLAAGLAATKQDDVLVEKFDATGALDPAFGTGGVTSTNIGPGTTADEVGGAVLDGTGRLVVAGTTTSADEGTRWFAARYLPTAAATITVQPVTTTACGGTAVVTVTATGTDPLSYQWQKSSSASGPWTNLVDGAGVSGSQTTRLTLTGLASSTLVRVSIDSPGGTTVSQAAAITPGSAPAIAAQPSNQTVPAGGVATFSASASGTPGPDVAWSVQLNGSSTYTPIAGATAPSYSFTVAAGDDGNRYRARFSNTCGAATTVAARLHVP